jgi:hydrogenase nickel incorporation protein HypB
MSKKDVIVLADLLGTNKQIASEIRAELERRGILAVNLLSSPGAGKTTLLEQIAVRIKDTVHMAVIEGDIETERDADRIRAKGVSAWQITTGGACHLEAKMIGKLLPSLDPGVELLFIENVGNLVCPASYELGESLRIVLLSTPEGDDKPKKYPKAFITSDILVLTKADLLPYLPFDLEKVKAEALDLNPRLRIFVTSAVTGEGVDDLIAHLAAARHKLRDRDA